VTLDRRRRKRLSGWVHRIGGGILLAPLTPGWADARETGAASPARTDVRNRSGTSFSCRADYVYAATTEAEAAIPAIDVKDANDDRLNHLEISAVEIIDQIRVIWRFSPKPR
jgi:hypothetical protein